jgi:hypothetical protein
VRLTPGKSRVRFTDLDPVQLCYFRGPEGIIVALAEQLS